VQSRPRASELLLAGILASALLFAGPRSIAQFSSTAPLTGSGSAASIPESDLMQPETLKGLLGSSDKPMVVQVGSRIFFAETHITGSVFAGPGSQPSGLQMLDSQVAGVSKKKLIVLYCGCCPWSRCPNVAPAYKRLHDLGYSNVKVLYLADNFGDNWVSKGYPVEHGK